MAKPELKKRARELRVRGYSLKEIVDEIGCSQSTISLWVRDIELTDEQQERLDKKKETASQENLQKIHAEHYERRERYRQQGKLLAAANDKFRVICALYYGEGSKTRPAIFALANSDPKLLSIIANWLNEMGHNDWTFRVHYYPSNGYSELEIKDWWKEKIPNLTDDKFRKFFPKKEKKKVVPEKMKNLYGVATIRLNNVRIRQMVGGGIEYLTENY